MQRQQGQGQVEPHVDPAQVALPNLPGGDQNRNRQNEKRIDAREQYHAQREPCQQAPERELPALRKPRAQRPQPGPQQILGQRFGDRIAREPDLDGVKREGSKRQGYCCHGRQPSPDQGFVTC
jgi:hypothetical protein